MGAAIGLGDVVGEAQHLLGVGVVPLHGDFDRELGVEPATGGNTGGALGVEDGRVQDVLGAIDVFDEAFDATSEGEVVFLAVALVHQADLDAVVEEGELSEPLGEDFVVELDVCEDFLVGEKVQLGATLGGVAEYAQRTDLDAANQLDDAILRHPAVELDEVLLAVALDGQAQPLGQGIDAGHTDAVQAA